MSRHELQQRHQLVLGALLRGEVPDGFEPRSAGLTVRVLRVKRRSDALEAVPALAEIEHLAERFDRWAAGHPRTGCAHDDVVDFVTDDVLHLLTYVVGLLGPAGPPVLLERDTDVDGAVVRAELQRVRHAVAGAAVRA